jgi:NAD(P)-dependent dehydrogenase (short-subunit alcohol dehydrogenase family)
MEKPWRPGEDHRHSRSGAYRAVKSAEWSLTNALRLELAPQGTQVTALHVGYMDTDMTRRLDVPKSDPAAIAKLAIDGMEAGNTEIIADETSRRVLARLSAGVTGLYPRSPTAPGPPGESPLREPARPSRCLAPDQRCGVYSHRPPAGSRAG